MCRRVQVSKVARWSRPFALDTADFSLGGVDEVSGSPADAPCPTAAHARACWPFRSMAGLVTWNGSAALAGSMRVLVAVVRLYRRNAAIVCLTIP